MSGKFAMGPHVIVVPPIGCDESVIDEYVGRFLSIRSLIDASLVDVMVSDRTISSLHETGLYPILPQFNLLMKNREVQSLTAYDVSSVVTAIIEKRTALEHYLQFDDVLASHTVIAPELSEGMDTSAFVEMREWLLLLLAVGQHRSGDSIPYHCTETKSSSVIVTCTIDAGDGPAFTHAVTPFDVCQHVPIFGQIRQFLAKYDDVALWINGASDVERGTAVSIAYLQRAWMNGLDYGLTDVPCFHFHRHFATSAEKLGFLHEPGKVKRLIGCIVALLFDPHDRSGHDLRENQGGNAPTLMRNRDSALRVDIDHEFHLHLWRLAGGGLQFANVVHHNDYAISF